MWGLNTSVLHQYYLYVIEGWFYQAVFPPPYLIEGKLGIPVFPVAWTRKTDPEKRPGFTSQGHLENQWPGPQSGPENRYFGSKIESDINSTTGTASPYFQAEITVFWPGPH